MEVLFLAIVLGAVILVIYVSKTRVRCVNCRNVMSLMRWKTNKGCLGCGSDLYDKVKT